MNRLTRDEIERLLHCARHEAQGAGPNTLAEVCEWALERAVTCDRIANEMRKRCEAAEAEAAKWKAECERVMDSVQLVPDAEAAYVSGLIDRAEMCRAKLAQLRNVLGPSVPPCCGGCHSEWTEALRILKGERDE